MLINYGEELILDLQGCNPTQFSEENIRKFLIELCDLIKMKRHGDPLFWHDYTQTPHLKGVSVMQFIETSDIVIHGLDFLETALINIFSCKKFDTQIAIHFSKEFFQAKTHHHTLVLRKTKAFDNPKVEVRTHPEHGQGLFAKEKIYDGETIAVFDGKIITAQKASDIPNLPPTHIRDHSIQFAKDKYRISQGIASYANHSCSPNCGIQNKFKIVTMQEIEPNEEITFDYDMSENSDWSMQCSCNSKECRKTIHGHQYLPQEKKIQYQNFISEWLTK